MASTIDFSPNAEVGTELRGRAVDISMRMAVLCSVQVNSTSAAPSSVGKRHTTGGRLIPPLMSRIMQHQLMEMRKSKISRWSRRLFIVRGTTSNISEGYQQSLLFSQFCRIQLAGASPSFALSAPTITS